MHARIGSHLRVSLRTIRCVSCYSTGVRQVRPETIMAIRISSAEVGSESSRNLKKSTPSRPTLSPELPNELRRDQKTSPGGPPTLVRDTKSLPSALGDLPDAPTSAPSGAQPSLPGPPGSSPAFKKPMFSLRKTNNSQLSAPSRGSPAQDPDLGLNGNPYYPQPPAPQTLFLLPLEGQTSS